MMDTPRFETQIVFHMQDGRFVFILIGRYMDDLEVTPRIIEFCGFFFVVVVVIDSFIFDCLNWCQGHKKYCAYKSGSL